MPRRRSFPPSPKDDETRRPRMTRHGSQEDRPWLTEAAASQVSRLLSSGIHTYEGKTWERARVRIRGRKIII
ncbi:hypothetical protein PLICRDRAFT_375640 [Plicaturopsis crispa FD-325 SS-3]|uniref:Unplaced genomic scaffold PLICRscaffold_19, whole genome shotgun sequence n=1 Tax=Plicaturopsis crispa FD-325 SS-3 TaxID=944288 RepID=A0A0C9T7X7_PLICR|nr:hypothetical protein PLICRDRAFT_375640 [Plicaturopsis crispa FD-325 SS-3]